VVFPFPLVPFSISLVFSRVFSLFPFSVSGYVREWLGRVFPFSHCGPFFLRFEGLLAPPYVCPFFFPSFPVGVTFASLVPRGTFFFFYASEFFFFLFSSLLPLFPSRGADGAAVQHTTLFGMFAGPPGAPFYPRYTLFRFVFCGAYRSAVE